MEVIKENQAMQGADTFTCKTVEYAFAQKALDLGVAIITGRYPEDGYCKNLISTELVYVLDGSGSIHFEDTTLSLQKGDAVLVNRNEKYYWDSEYCKVAIVCTPAWSKEQYEIVK